MTVLGRDFSGVPSLGSASRPVAASAIHRGAQREVDEPGAADRGRLGDVVDVKVADDLVRDVAGRLAEPLPERQCDVGLEVGERRRADQRVRASVVRAIRGYEGVAHPCAENLLWICHG